MLLGNMDSDHLRSIRVFLSYSHEDKQIFKKLKQHLAVLRRTELIQCWDDGEIVAGSELDRDIAAKLETAELSLLLVSASFLASDYCYCREMGRAIERQSAGLARVIPIIIRPCSWNSTPFARLLALPSDGKPITSWRRHDMALVDVVQGIERVLNVLVSQPRALLDAASARVDADPNVDCLLISQGAEAEDLRLAVRNNSSYALTDVRVSLSIPIDEGDEVDVFQVVGGVYLGDLQCGDAKQWTCPKELLDYMIGRVEGETSQQQFLGQLHLAVDCKRASTSESLFWVFRFRLSSNGEGWIMEQALKRRSLGNQRLFVKTKEGKEGKGGYGRGEFFLEPKYR
jgi:hypothetical protein